MNGNCSPWKEPGATAIANTTRRGYTGHEHLDNLGLIHMNGRVQDPTIGRFLSADPFVPNPLSGQSFNRYSYVVNNPLSLIDPSGFDETNADGNGYDEDTSVLDSLVSNLLRRFNSAFSGWQISLSHRNPLYGAPEFGVEAGDLRELTDSTVDAIIFSAEPSSASASAPRGRRFRGRATPETRRAAFEAASAWARSQGLIDFTPKYEDRYVFNLHLVTGSRPVDCGADPLCGTQRRMTGGSTSGRNVIVYRAGVEPWLWANDQLVADPDRIAPDRGTWAVNQALNLRSGTESALFVLGHENWHVNNPIRRPARPEDQALEWDANWAGYLFLQAWRNR